MRTFPSIQGQRSHLAQAKRCHEKWRADLDTLHIPSHDDNDQTAGIGEHPAMDWNADAPYIPEPDDEPPVLEEHAGENQDEDHDDGNPSSKPRWRDYFPHPAGQGTRKEPTAFESLRNAQVARGESIWGMFTDEGDWDFARWILKSGTTHASTDELLELKKVSQRSLSTRSLGVQDLLT
jgi:hypothetical protein